MATLDRFLAVLVSNNATALHLAADEVARLTIGDAPRPLTRQPLTAQQLMSLVREIAPPDALRALDAGGDARFVYRCADGPFAVRAAPGAPGLSVEVRIATEREAEAEGSTTAARAPTPVDVRVSDAAERTRSAMRAELEELLRQMLDRDASDLHLRVGEPPIMRTHGEMLRLADRAPLAHEALEAMLLSIMPDRNRSEFEQHNDTDFAHEIPGAARFRCNALRDRKGAAAVFRVIPARVVTVEQLGISDHVQRLCQLTRGLVLVTGPTGSGKSTTLCSLIDLVNRTRSDHVITIEDPIEFVHENKRCIITQRQVGMHTGSFKQALRAALREDPDIILVGELRDLETVSIAIETAETGHLVFGTLHTTTAAGTVDRLIDQFPADRQEQVRVMLAESLKGVISQTLCKKIGGGRAAAREILITMPAISNLIREGKTFQIPSIIQTSKRLGMVTLNDALIELVDGGQVEAREAYYKANDKQGFASMLHQRGHDASFLDASEAAGATASGGVGGARADVGTKAPPRAATVGRG